MTLLNHVLTGMPSTKRIAVIENPSFSKVLTVNFSFRRVWFCSGSTLVQSSSLRLIHQLHCFLFHHLLSSEVILLCCHCISEASRWWSHVREYLMARALSCYIGVEADRHLWPSWRFKYQMLVVQCHGFGQPQFTNGFKLSTNVVTLIIAFDFSVSNNSATCCYNELLQQFERNLI